MSESKSKKWIILSVVTLSAFITNVDATIVVVGLPKLMGGLHIGITTGLWTLTSYMITSTVFLLPAGRWSDVIGTKRVFLIGFGIFTVATVLCGLAGSGSALLVYRFIQGTGAALALATATPIIVRAFPQAELGRALGINSTSWVIGSIVGPAAGGALVNFYDWRAIFFVTVPFAVIGFIGAWRVLPKANPGTHRSIDWPGDLTFGLGLVGVLLALSEGGLWGWGSAKIIGLFAVSAALLGSFVLIERRVSQPLFHLSLLKHSHFRTGLGVTLSYSIGYFATTFLLTMYLQGALDLSPLDAGLLLVPLSIPQLFMGPVGGILADRWGPARGMLIGVLLLIGAGIWLGSLHTSLSASSIIIPLLMMSTATGLAWPALTKVVMSAAPSSETGSASGMFYTLRNVGVSLSLTLALVIAEVSVPPQVATRALAGTSSKLSHSLVASLVHATDTGFRFFVLFFAAALVLILFLFRRVKITTAVASEESGQ